MMSSPLEQSQCFETRLRLSSARTEFSLSHVPIFPFALRRREAPSRRAAVLQRVALLMLLAVSNWPAVAAADIGAPPALRDVRIEEHLGDRVPFDVALITASGTTTSLGSFFDGHRPVLLTLFYARCPMLCSLVLDGAARAMRDATQRPGIDYRAFSLSIDPREAADPLTARRAALIGMLPEHSPADAWEFARSNETAIRRLTDALGFAYRYDSATQQYAHPAALFVLTGDGRISRYLYGFDPTPAELDAALENAAAGRVGQGAVQRLLLQCFQYAPALRQHAGAVRALLAVGGALILLATLAVLMGSAYARRRAESRC